MVEKPVRTKGISVLSTVLSNKESNDIDKIIGVNCSSNEDYLEIIYEIIVAVKSNLDLSDILKRKKYLWKHVLNYR